MATHRSTTKRAAQAVALTLGFYLLALLIVCLLLAWPMYELLVSHRIHSLHLTGVCVISAGIILYSLWPRADRSVPMGLPITERDHPLLFAEIKQVAQRLRQRAPREVYLDLNMNAGVTERGSILSSSGDRLMMIGLPLLHYLTVAQFRTTLAHEFGHFIGGDTKHGVWIWRSRLIMERTIINLGTRSWLQAPFRWYAETFMRITQAVAREQEFQADFAAAKVFGGKEAIEALRAIYGVAPAYEWYWMTEYEALHAHNLRAPVLEGFAHFRATAAVQNEIRAIMDSPVDREHIDEFDSHPTFRERLAALANLPATFQSSTDNRPAMVLLGNVPDLEGIIANEIRNRRGEPKLTPVAWEEATNRTLVVDWRKLVMQQGDLLGKTTIETLPEVLALKEQFVAKVAGRVGVRPDSKDAEGAAMQLAFTSMAVALLDAGWSCTRMPGEEPAFSRNGQTVQFSEMISKLVGHELSTSEWLAWCNEYGIGSLRLYPSK